jgi:hypothetical protein
MLPEALGHSQPAAPYNKSPLEATLEFDLEALLGGDSWTGLESLWQPAEPAVVGAQFGTGADGGWVLN